MASTRSVDIETLMKILGPGQKIPLPVVARVREYVESCPVLPEILGVTEAAQLLGVRKPHLYRLRDQERLPAPAAEIMAGQIFVKEDLVPLAQELEAERAARAEKREARDADPAESVSSESPVAA